CFLTGRYPRTCRARQNGADIPEDEILLTKILSEHGYICGLSGKLHLSTCDPRVNKGLERRIDDGYDDFHWSHDNTNLWICNEYFQWLKEKKAINPMKRFKKSRFVQYGWPEEYHQTTWCVEKAINFIQQASGFQEPWLFSINIFDPHHSFDPPESYLNRYLEFFDEIPFPNYLEGELENKTEWQKLDHNGAYGQTERYNYNHMKHRDHKSIKAAYWAMCDLIDAQIGRLINVLEETNQLEDTIIIFMSDHGEMLGDHGIYLKGPYFYEPAIHVPLIIYWKNHFTSKTIKSLVELIDLPQTILDILDISHHPGMQGKSLMHLISSDKKTVIEEHKKDIYCEYYNAMSWHKEPTAQATMIRTKNYKLVLDHTRSYGELYDLEKDPSETYNFWNDEDYSTIKTDMLIRLANRMAFTVDPLPLRKGNF
ncbi:MAG: sulfatase-like hydrolase/transferase, partial [Candidatus Lokiarchaeota archaeon]|nr:sulfatase-like hydrolase/transferase [Candidatus Lokiarchaeota archaeon]MBD3201157.1 sulfatase-like hydrolase/transferase [Candidatus Lokiarchaeota archaeon]